MPPPNIIFIFADDLGYGDLSCYGNPTLITLNLDKMAAGGLKFTQFYSVAPVCTPSRAALLTGCYPKRVGLHQHVLFPNSNIGLNPAEVTLPEILKSLGYRTACFGKWHLGHHQKFLPLQHGFDEYWGIPFSNDMSKKEQERMGEQGIKNYTYLLPVIEQNDTVELEPDQSLFTRKITDKALDFIERNRHNPFFLYVPYPMPHIPVYASKPFIGTSKRGLYGDAVEEIDWSVGKIMDKLKALNIEDRTLVIFTSDNGPWLKFKTEGGSAGPLRGGKGTTWEGGVRVPCIFYWPGHIPEGNICTEVVSLLDILPTLAYFAGSSLTYDVDGRNIGSLLLNPAISLSNPSVFFYYSKNGTIEGVRKNKWKLKMEDDDVLLFDLEQDVGENYDLAHFYPEKITELTGLMYAFDADLTRAARPVGVLTNK